MGDVVGMDGKAVDPLETSLEQAFRDHGQARVAIDELSCTAAHWRRTARWVARRLGRPVRTIEHGGVLQAALTDWPRDPREEVIHRAALRAAVEAVQGPPSAGSPGETD